MKIRFHRNLASGLPSIKLNVGRPTKDPEKLEFDEFHHYPIPGRDAHFLTWSKKKFIHWDKKTRRLRINKQIIIKEMEVDGFGLVTGPFCPHCLANYGKIFRLKKLWDRRLCPNCRMLTK